MSFDRLARHYRWMEAVLAGGILQRCRTAFIDPIREPAAALLVGEGNGRFLGPFLESNQSTRVVCVEQSEQMIVQARKALNRRGIDPARVEFIRQDVLGWDPPGEEFDLIVTHFFLDCFTEPQLRLLVPRLAASGRPDCTWLLADFQLPDAGFGRLRARAIHKLMYVFFWAATALPARRLTDPDPLLREAGFQLSDRITAQWDLLRSDCWIRRGA
ncbi:MAG: class I SAM-dependent methyltransferase [Opitutales bacterium]